MDYIDYDYYETYGGTCDDDNFPRMYYRAKAQLDARTYGRLLKDTTVSDNVKHCMCELVDLAWKAEELYGADGGAAAVMSASNDGVSETYANASAVDWYERVQPRRAEDIMQMYLANERNEAGVMLLYRGVSR